MAVKLKKTTQADQLLKLISLTDTAIDWGKSYTHVEDSEDEDWQQRKVEHVVSPDLSKLSFKDGEAPTLFVFKHPRRVDVRRELRAAYAKQMQGKSQDIFSEVWELAFIGTEEGLDGVKLDTAPRRGGKLTTEYCQALEDAGVLPEMANALLNYARSSVDDDETVLKK